MKRISFLLLAAAVLVMLTTGVALANFGPHGGYVLDTDACAGCHRAHTGTNELTWTDGFGNTSSALLVSNATSMSEFCYACHGNAAPGASTNVVAGVFDAGPSSYAGPTLPSDSGTAVVRWATNSTAYAPLNGGGFANYNGNPISSSHGMDVGTGTPAWGYGSAVADSPTFSGNGLTCTDCHDPHGSSNYRLLKDKVAGQTVGGYTTVAGVDIPNPYVISAEQGYPDLQSVPGVGVVTGWLKHQLGADQIAAYVPNYTAEELAYRANAGVQQRSISGWCSACHQVYIGATSAYANINGGAATNFKASPYNYSGNGVPAANGGVNANNYHRHPMNITLAAGNGPSRALAEQVTTSTLLPLEMAPGSVSADFRGGKWGYTDYLGCLTCHRAHGTDTTMTGYAAASFNASGYPVPNPALNGVPPTNDSALLRVKNRGVCERCHNK